jgi:RimJ/RimL family protein N-acetyltransferase/acyl carrier protein
MNFIHPLEKTELYRRLDQLVPGDQLTEDVIPSFNIEIFCERLNINGLDEMHHYSTDERLYEYFEFQPFATIDETRAYIEKLKNRIGEAVMDRTAMYWFVRRKKDGKLIGLINLISLSYERQSVEWGFGVDPELWGHGYILPIQEILKHYVFEILQLNRLQGMTMVGNQRTISSLLASGMRHEGTLKDYYCKKGTFHDAWQYAMLSTEYFQSSKIRPDIRTRYTTQDVVDIVSSVLTEEQITAESTMRTALSWDSLNHMSIMVAISLKTGINLSPSEMMRANSVQTITAILLERTVKK